MQNSTQSYIKEICDTMYEASRDIRILRSVAWEPGVRESFLENGGTSMPEVEYPTFDPSDTLEILDSLKPRIRGVSDFSQWAVKTAEILRNSAYLLASMGTGDFFNYSKILYGSPKEPLPDGMSTSLELAGQFEQLHSRTSEMDLGQPPDACLLAGTVRDQIETAVNAMFGDAAPEVKLDDDMAANAIAGRRRIRIRDIACFTKSDVDQLIHHEASIHVTTAINGREQEHLKILRAAHPGTTKTQEGLAVFAELITGSLDLDRLRRLSDRVLAIQMVIDGADFIEIYRYYLERTDNPEQSFENARRIFRGGLLTGGAPFTKDMVYLDGLLRVHNFMRIMVAEGRFDYLKLLFCGKLDLEDIPMLHQMDKEGILVDPRFLPPWMEDRRFLLSYLMYSSFLNTIDLQKVRLHYQEMID